MWTEENINTVAVKHFPNIDKQVALKRPILYSNWFPKVSTLYTVCVFVYMYLRRILKQKLKFFLQILVSDLVKIYIGSTLIFKLIFVNYACTLLHFCLYNYKFYVLNFNLNLSAFFPSFLVLFSPPLLSSSIIYQLIRKTCVIMFKLVVRFS